MAQWLIVGWVSLLSGCAILHHVQVGEIDNRAGYKRERFDIKVSELGVNFDNAAQLADNLGGNGQIAKMNRIASLFRSGRSTGNPVFVEDYARKLNEAILTECPSGRVTEVIAVRETNNYHVVSGEIVRVMGTCLSK